MKSIFQSRLIIVLLLTYLSLFVSCRKDRNGILVLEIVDEQIKINRNPLGAIGGVSNSAEIKYRISNKSDIDVLLYNFTTDFTISDLQPEYLCDSLNGAADKLIFVKDEMGVQMGVISSTNVVESFHKVFEKSKASFKSNEIVIRSGESLEFSGIADFKELDIQYPGTYNLRLLYTQTNVSYYVSDEEVESDIKKSKAFLFKGCLWSNEVNLVVD